MITLPIMIKRVGIVAHDSTYITASSFNTWASVSQSRLTKPGYNQFRYNSSGKLTESGSVSKSCSGSTGMRSADHNPESPRINASREYRKILQLYGENIRTGTGCYLV